MSSAQYVGVIHPEGLAAFWSWFLLALGFFRREKWFGRPMMAAGATIALTASVLSGTPGPALFPVGAGVLTYGQVREAKHLRGGTTIGFVGFALLCTAVTIGLLRYGCPRR